MKVGIDSISLYTPNSYYGLRELAERHGVEPEKYLYGLGQEQMSVPAPDEDIVTMAANAAAEVVEDAGPDNVATVILATESGIDQSKSAGLFVHQLIGLPANCRVFELKQACYGATAGVQMACAMVRQRPQERVLVVASDIARYERGSQGECTQGAGAVAMLITADPRILEIHPEQGKHSADVMDFWRPNYRSTALVDGALSLDAYHDSLASAWADYRRDGGLSLGELPWLCFHQPFTKMARKAFNTLCELEPEAAASLSPASYEYSQHYGRRIGNCYTASLYIALQSLLETCEEDLAGQNVGFFSYGSGSVGEFFSGTIVAGYQDRLDPALTRAMLDGRQPLDETRYVNWFYGADHDVDAARHVLPVVTTGRYRLSGIIDHKRVYEDGAERLKQAV